MATLGIIVNAADAAAVVFKKLLRVWLPEPFLFSFSLPMIE
jgi:hypothetical protein